MPTEPCRHAHGEILLCSRCFMGQADQVDHPPAHTTGPEGPKPVLQVPEKSAVPTGANRGRRPFEGVAQKPGRPSKLQKAREALKGILERERAKEAQR